MKTFIRGTLAVLLLTAVYACTSPGNRLEAEDAYEYAWQVDAAPSLGYPPLWHPHHLAYLPVIRILYAALHGAGGCDHSYSLMCAVSSLAAAWGVVCVFRIMGMAGASRGWSAVIAAGLAASYGWWRYAWEAEMYAPAGALGLTALLLAVQSLAVSVSPRSRKTRTVASALVGAAATLVHVQAAIAALIAIPVFLWRAGRIKEGVQHLLLCGGIVAAAYGAAIAMNAWPEDAARGDMGPRERSEIAKMPAKAVIGQGQAIASGNFIFGYASARDRLEKLFPYRMLDEEMQMGRATPRWVKALAPMTLAALLASLLALAILRLRVARTASSSGVIAEPMHMNAMRWAVASWFACTAAVAALFEPGNPEMWILALPPLVVGGGLWMAIGYSSVPPLQRALFKTACAAAVLLCLHNAIGGWAPLSTRAGDYARARGEAALEALRPGDVLLTGDGPVMFRWLRYHAPFCARVESVLFWPADQRDAGYERMRTMLRNSGGRMILLPDVRDPPRALEFRFAHQVRTLRDWAARHETEWSPAPDVPGAWEASLTPEK